MSETTHKLFSNKVLYIPDFILPQDIPKVYHYFDNYNIAKLKSVEVFDHPEPEYNCEDKAYYGYAIIIIDEWYNNNIAKTFYESLIENRCKMVYDDPLYWDLEFNEDNIINKITEVTEVTEVVEDNKINKDDKIVMKIEESNNASHSPVILDNVLDKYNIDYDTCSQDSFESCEENDDPNDEDYELSDSENEEDNAFEYYIKYEKKKLNKSKKYNCKKRKYNEEVEALKKENIELKELLIKRNKNYLKNNKKKPEKNVWSRRLRVKTSY